MKRIIKLISIICVFIILSLSLFGCFPIESYYGDPIYGDPIDLELSGEVSMRYVYDQEFECYDVYLEGIVENTEDKELTFCCVSFTLYDKDGNVIGTAEDYINNLKAGAKWRFSASGSMGYEPASFEIDELYGYDN